MSSNRAVTYTFMLVSLLLLPLLVLLKLTQVVHIWLAKLLWFLGGDAFTKYLKLKQEKV